jgi:hypothetical protein
MNINSYSRASTRFQIEPNTVTYDVTTVQTKRNVFVDFIISFVNFILGLFGI